MIGSNILVDMESGFFRDTNRQISEVCEILSYKMVTTLLVSLKEASS
jgi:hypothetical protein